MQLNMIGMVVAAGKPSEAAAWFVEHFGLAVGIDIGWYVNMQHPAHPTVSIDVVQRDHDSWPASARGPAVVGSMLAFLVDDVDAEFARLSAAGLDVVKPLVTEPWGQRRFQLAGPDGIVVEVVQRVAPDPQWLADNGFA